MAELTYAELIQVGESTRLPHTHKFTSLKHVVISALHKIDKRIHIEIFFVHTYVTYENLIWPNLCYIQKLYLCLHLFFYI